MSYIKIIGEDERYHATIDIFTTQHGNQGIRFIGDEIPDTDKGFQMYDDENKLICDLSHYKYLYGSSNVYSSAPEEIEHPIGNNESIASASVYDGLSRRINQVAQQIEEVAPYTDSKPVYIDNTEVIFDCDRRGAVNAWLVIDGVQVNCDYEVADGRIRLIFDPLESVGTAHISVQ